MGKIKIAIAGVGNCASALIQGFHYYKDESVEPIGLMHYDLGGYKPSDIEVVAAFDIDKRKVGRDLSRAIFAKPNCTKIFCKEVPYQNVEVQMGQIRDGYSKHMINYPEEQAFRLSTIKELTDEEIISVLKESGAEMLINYLPVGSELAAKLYADCCLEAGIGFINCMPVFIASKEDWSKKFYDKNIPIIGDDIKSQIGATITHRVLSEIFKNRGVPLDRTYQLNTGGNTDFLNMKNHERLTSKKISKTNAVQSTQDKPLDAYNIHIGPSDYVAWQNDNKVAFIRMEGRIFGNIPINLELRLSVEDSPNSGGVVIDAIRCMKLALDRGTGGILFSPSAYFMKSPPTQMNDIKAMKRVEMFIKGEKER